MAVTLAQLRTRIRTEINKPSTSYESFIDDAIRSAIRFYSASRFWFLEETDTWTLSSASNYLILPADFHLPVTMRISVNDTWRGHDNGFKHITFDALKLLSVSASATGAPEYWTLFGNKMLASVTADQDYTVDASYIKKDESMPEEDEDESIWFEEGQDVIRQKAMEYVYRDRLHMYDKANEHEAKAATALSVLQATHNQRQITSGLLRG